MYCRGLSDPGWRLWYRWLEMAVYRVRIPTQLNGIHGILTFHSERATTVSCGLVSSMFMPEYPHKVRLLKPIERDYPVWRLEMEAAGGEADGEITVWKGFKMAFSDPKIWALVWCMGLSQSMGSTGNII